MTSLSVPPVEITESDTTMALGKRHKWDILAFDNKLLDKIKSNILFAVHYLYYYILDSATESAKEDEQSQSTKGKEKQVGIKVKTRTRSKSPAAPGMQGNFERTFHCNNSVM